MIILTKTRHRKIPVRQFRLISVIRQTMMTGSLAAQVLGLSEFDCFDCFLIEFALINKSRSLTLARFQKKKLRR